MLGLLPNTRFHKKGIIATGKFRTLQDSKFSLEIENIFPICTIESQKQMWKFWRMRDVVGTRANRQVFLQLFQILSNFHKCFYYSTKTQRTCIQFLLRNFWDNNKKTTWFTNHQSVNCLCLCHHYKNSLCQLCFCQVLM